MKLRQLGSTDLFASEIALGTAELGLDYGIPAHGQHFRPVEGDAIRLLHEALDLGINFVDTARVYGNSEAIIGKGLIHRRADYILATKLVPLAACDLGNPILGSRIRQSIETSLRTLKTDYIDLLLVHSASLEVIRRSSELLEALRKMQRKGYVRYVGASVYEEAGGEALSLIHICMGMGSSYSGWRIVTSLPICGPATASTYQISDTVAKPSI